MMTDPTDAPPLSADDVVMIADDEAFSRFLTAELFDQLGKPQIIAARDGHEALALLADPAAAELRVVVLDFNMPGVNGIEVLKAIRSGGLAVAHDVIVMMVTSVDVLVLVAAAVALDVDAFLSKPTSAAVLRRHLTELLGSGRDCQPAERYAAIDVEWMVAGGMIDTSLGQGEAVGLADLREGMVIARNLLDPSGGLVVAAGTRVTARLQRLLHWLADAGVSLDGLRVVRPC